MNDLDELFGTGGETAEPAEDLSRYGRVTPNKGPRADFELLVRTRFEKGLPETARFYVTQLPLPCGHNVTKENPAVYCSRCGEETCTACARTCSHCGRLLGGAATCRCGVLYRRDGVESYVCLSRCRSVLRVRRVLEALVTAVTLPFRVEEVDDDDE